MVIFWDQKTRRNYRRNLYDGDDEFVVENSVSKIFLWRGQQNRPENVVNTNGTFNEFNVRRDIYEDHELTGIKPVSGDINRNTWSGKRNFTRGN